MKVAIVTTSFPRTASDDAGIFVARLVGALEQNGIEGIVIAPKDQEEEYQAYRNFQTVRVSYTLFLRRMLAYGSGILPNIKRNPWAVIQIPGLLCAFLWTLLRYRKDYEVIHANWLINVIPSVCAGWILRKPVVVTARGEDLRLLRSKVVRVFIRPFLCQAETIVVVGENLSDELGTLVPPLRDRILTIENGVEPEVSSQVALQQIREKFSLNLNSKYLIFVGSLIPRKGIEETITIFSQVNDKSTELLLCGRLEHTEYVEKCRLVAENHGVGGRVHFLGPLSPSEVWGLLALSTLFISSSEFEGRPNAILEALSVGVPVFASKIPAHESVVVHGYSGYLFSSVEDAAIEIDKILSDRERCNQLSDNARTSMRGRDWRTVAQHYSDVYKKVLVDFS